MTDGRVPDDARARALTLCRDAVAAPDMPYAAQEALYAELDELLLGHDGLGERLHAEDGFHEIRRVLG